MEDLNSLKARLAREEAVLASTAEQMEATEREVKEAQQHIEVGQRKIQQLRAAAEAVEKRIALLRQYIEMVESGEGDVGSPPAPAAPQEAPAATDHDPISFGSIDEQRLSDEILPKAHTFEEELLLLMAHHRRAIRPKDICRIFRSLEYAPRGHASEAAIKEQLDAAPYSFERVGGGRYALTREGREEAEKLLEELGG